jgi:hypothetical protein
LLWQFIQINKGMCSCSLHQLKTVVCACVTSWWYVLQYNDNNGRGSENNVTVSSAKHCQRKPTDHYTQTTHPAVPWATRLLSTRSPYAPLQSLRIVMSFPFTPRHVTWYSHCVSRLNLLCISNFPDAYYRPNLTNSSSVDRTNNITSIQSFNLLTQFLLPPSVSGTPSYTLFPDVPSLPFLCT